MYFKLKVTSEVKKKFVRILGISLIIGLALGYLTFYLVFPNLSFPSDERISLFLLLAMFFLFGGLCGFLVDDVESIVIYSITSIVIGMIVSFIIFISPTFSREISSEYLFESLLFLYKFSIPIVIAEFLMIFIGSMSGYFFYQKLCQTMSTEDPFIRKNEKKEK